MEQKNKHLEVEIRRLEDKNDELRDENRRLHNFLNVMLQTIKKFFNKLLHIGTEKDKDDVVRRNSDAISELNLAYVAITRARKELYATELFNELSLESSMVYGTYDTFNIEEFSIKLPDLEEIVAIDVAI